MTTYTGLLCGDCGSPLVWSESMNRTVCSYWLDQGHHRPAGGRTFVDVVFDGAPGAVTGRFVDTETPDGQGVGVGTWIKRDNGMWALRIPVAIADVRRDEPTPASPAQVAPSADARLPPDLQPAHLRSLIEGGRRHGWTREEMERMCDAVEILLAAQPAASTVDETFTEGERTAAARLLTVALSWSTAGDELHTAAKDLRFAMTLAYKPPEAPEAAPEDEAPRGTRFCPHCQKSFEGDVDGYALATHIHSKHVAEHSAVPEPTAAPAGATLRERLLALWAERFSRFPGELNMSPSVLVLCDVLDQERAAGRGGTER